MPKRRYRKSRVAHHAFNHAYSAAAYGRFEKAALFRPDDSLFAIALIGGLGLLAWVATVLYALVTSYF